MLILTAAPAEARAVARGLGVRAPGRDWEAVDAGDGWWVARTGVGKVNAGVCAALLCERGFARAVVVNVGVCGALARRGKMAELGAVVVGSESVYADEGVVTRGGFVMLGELGFPMWDAGRGGGERRAAARAGRVVADPRLLKRVVGLPPLALRVLSGPIATVSECSGTDTAARAVTARTGAVAEAMEGAAIGHSLMRMRGPGRFLEVRVVSNTTGDREKQRWDLAGALRTLSGVAAALRGSGLGSAESQGSPG